jgi:hypothetical protein
MYIIDATKPAGYPRWRDLSVHGGTNAMTMIIERAAGEAVHIGGCTLWVLAVNKDEVVFGLHDPNAEDLDAEDIGSDFDEE